MIAYVKRYDTVFSNWRFSMFHPNKPEQIILEGYYFRSHAERAKRFLESCGWVCGEIEQTRKGR